MNLVPQFGFLELILIAVIALIVVGPRDLPRMMRQAGRMVGKAKAMASEFTAAFDQMARETEMDELRKELDALKNDNVVAKAKRDLDAAVKPIADDINKAAGALPAGGAARHDDGGSNEDSAPTTPEDGDHPAVAKS